MQSLQYTSSCSVLSFGFRNLSWCLAHANTFISCNSWASIFHKSLCSLAKVWFTKWTSNVGWRAFFKITTLHFHACKHAQNVINYIDYSTFALKFWKMKPFKIKAIKKKTYVSYITTFMKLWNFPIHFQWRSRLTTTLWS